MCRAVEQKKIHSVYLLSHYKSTHTDTRRAAQQRGGGGAQGAQEAARKRLKEEAVAEAKARLAAFEETVQKLSTSTYTGEFLDGQRHGQGESSRYGIDDVVVYFFSLRMRPLPTLLY
jgi:hypothetical protein